MASILIWIVLGAIAGYVAGLIMKGLGLGLVGNIVVGIVGSFLGDWLAQKLDIAGAATGGLSLASIATAVAGAVVLLGIISLVKKA